jgi:outer membrane protein assembly factor BamE (lipoprotein component of BamABCDE complex)
MKIFYLILTLIFINNCTLDKVVIHHGVHNLEKKQVKLRINETNINDIIKLIGPPSTKSSFDNDVYIYIERKTSSSKLTKLGKKKLLVNNVLVLEINNRGTLVDKKFFNIDDMKKIKFDENKTEILYTKRSFIYNFLSSLRQKIDDPLGKKRIKN